MKTSIFSTLIYLFIAFSSFLTPVKSSASIGDTIKPIPRIDKEFLVVVHFVLDPDSNAGLERGILEIDMDEVNKIFAPIGASFKICEYRNIYNYSYLTIDDSTRAELMNKNHVDERINMYFVREIEGNSFAVCGNADLGGVAKYKPHNGIVIKYGECANPTTIAHEIGHYFGLLHTFEESGAELVDGSNCSIAGDKICDTPGDPFYESGDASKFVNEECVFFNTQKDGNGDFYDPDVSNIMGYYGHCRCLKFTRGQYEYMTKYYLQNPFLW